MQDRRLSLGPREEVEGRSDPDHDGVEPSPVVRHPRSCLGHPRPTNRIRAPDASISRTMRASSSEVKRPERRAVWHRRPSDPGTDA